MLAVSLRLKYKCSEVIFHHVKKIHFHNKILFVLGQMQNKRQSKCCSLFMTDAERCKVLQFRVHILSKILSLPLRTTLYPDLIFCKC